MSDKGTRFILALWQHTVWHIGKVCRFTWFASNCCRQQDRSENAEEPMGRMSAPFRADFLRVVFGDMGPRLVAVCSGARSRILAAPGSYESERLKSKAAQSHAQPRPRSRVAKNHKDEDQTTLFSF